MFADIATVIAPIFIIASIGFVWARTERPFDTEMVTTLVTNIGVPCLLFASLTGLDITPAAFGRSSATFAVVTLAILLIGAACLKAARLDISTYLPSVTFGNNGNMGLPLVLFAFGEPGLALGMGPFFVSTISNVTIGVGLLSGRLTLRYLVANRYIYVIAAALVFIIGGIKPPLWLTYTVKTLGSLTIPLMLVALGVSLARLQVKSFSRSLMLGLLRLGLGFAVGWGVAEIFGLTGAERGVLILQSAMPVAVMNFLFSTRYKRSPEEVAGMIVISTAISFATLPVLLWVVL